MGFQSVTRTTQKLRKSSQFCVWNELQIEAASRKAVLHYRASTCAPGAGRAVLPTDACYHYHHLKLTGIGRDRCWGSRAGITGKKGNFQLPSSVVSVTVCTGPETFFQLLMLIQFSLHNPGPNLKSAGFLNIYHSPAEDHVRNLFFKKRDVWGWGGSEKFSGDRLGK